MPRGFGKNYFTLSAILAYSVSRTLHAKENRIKRVRDNLRRHSEIADDEICDPPELTSSGTPVVATTPCHCNCYYKRKTRLVLLLNHFIPRCPYYNTYFAFRRTGVHPPLLSF